MVHRWHTIRLERMWRRIEGWCVRWVEWVGTWWRWWHWAGHGTWHVRSLRWMREHARGAVAASRVIAARDKACNVCWRQVSGTSGRVGLSIRRRGRVGRIESWAFWARLTRMAGVEIRVGTRRRRRRVENRLLVPILVYKSIFSRRATVQLLSWAILRNFEQFEDGWVRSVLSGQAVGKVCTWLNKSMSDASSAVALG